MVLMIAFDVASFRSCAFYLGIHFASVTFFQSLAL